MLEQMAAIREQPTVNEPIDGQTIAACQRGDRDALRLLFEAYKDRVYSIAIYSLGGDKTAAETEGQPAVSALCANACRAPTK